jgi:hypothetical protein
MYREEEKAAEKAAFKVPRRDGIEAPEETPGNFCWRIYCSSRIVTS